MRTMMAILLAAALLQAQDKPAEPRRDSREAVIIPVKTLTGDSFDRLVKLLAVFGAQYSADSQLRTIIVYAPEDVVDKMRKVVEELDRPGSEAAIGRNIDMTMTFLKCSVKPSSAPSVLPADMEPVAKQLRAATQYKNIELLDVIPLHLQEGKQTEQSVRLPGTGLGVATGNISLRPEAVGRKDQGRYVRFATLRVSFRIPVPAGPFQTGVGGAQAATQYMYADQGFNTSGDFMEGQKTVLGKVPGPEDDSAIFIVIALKVLD